MQRAPSGVSGREIPGWRLRNASAPGTGGKKKKKKKWQRSRCDSLLVCCRLRFVCALLEGRRLAESPTDPNLTHPLNHILKRKSVPKGY